MPLYQLLGGRARTSSCTATRAGDTIPDAAAYLERGYRAVRVQCAVPVYPACTGSTRYHDYEPAVPGFPPEDAWSTEAYLRFVPELLRQVRTELGFEFHLLHDVHHRLTPIEAVRLGKAVEEQALFWLEDPLPAERSTTCGACCT